MTRNMIQVSAGKFALHYFLSLCFVVLLAWLFMQAASATVNVLHKQPLRYSLRTLLLYTTVVAVMAAIAGALLR